MSAERRILTKADDHMNRTTILSMTAAALMAAPAFASSHDGPGTIVDIAVGADDFETLVAALEAADLVETLQGDGPFTVFAPVDAAFDALPEGAVEELLADPEALAEILTYHVVPGAVMSGDLEDGMMAETVQGGSVTIGVSDDGVTVDGANVVQADVEASNGVIHVIDAVIMPE